jgi:uncharacterized repeat protein (TIGR01451 family)
MSKRGKIGALVGAALLTFALGSTAFAKPLYDISVTKTASPTTVGSGGGDVTFTVVVTNTGTGSLAVVTVVDTMSTGTCTLSDPSGTGAPGTLASGDAWTYTCLVIGVLPGTMNTATVHACHNSGGPCNSDSQNATGSDSVTVTLTAPVATPSPTPSPTPGPTAGPTAIPSQPPTDTLGSTGGSGPADGAWLLVVALGVLLASAVILVPAKARNRR